MTAPQIQSKKAGVSRPFRQFRSDLDQYFLGSVPGNHRATPVEAIVQADLEGMLVVAGAAESRERERRQEVGLAEVVVLIFGLGRPVLGEHVFEAGTDGKAIVMAAVERESLRHAEQRQRLAVVGVRIAALGVEQSRTPGVAEAAGHRAEATLVVGVDKTGAREGNAVVVVAEPAPLAFNAEHPVRRELVVSADLQTAEEAAVVAAAVGADETIAAIERAADVAADVETGPLVDRLQ